jgi:hypothetical protein
MCPAFHHNFNRMAIILFDKGPIQISPKLIPTASQSLVNINFGIQLLHFDFDLLHP